jgi:hypothetical protein
MKAFLLFDRGNFDNQHGIWAMAPKCIIIAKDAMSASLLVGGFYYYEKGKLRDVVVFPKERFTKAPRPIKEEINQFEDWLEYKKGPLEISMKADEKEAILWMIELPFFGQEFIEALNARKTGEMEELRKWLNEIASGCSNKQTAKAITIPSSLPECDITHKACRYEDCPKVKTKK